ncbi:hypothetical protein BDW67DRAFT_120468 [Aspergillus spinulosporus]
MNALVQTSSALPVRIDDLTLCKWLRDITEFLVHYKNRLPEDARDLLSETFGKSRKSAKNQHLEPRARGARACISQVKDVLPSLQLLLNLEKFRRSPIQFWTKGLGLKVSWDSNNILRRIYQRNRANEMASVIHRAFDTTATYLLLRKIRDAFNADNLSTTVLNHCVKMILDQGDSQDDIGLVKETLKKDYHAGKRWHSYATKLGGYGAFFLIGVVPSWTFEITWNENEDLEFVVAHFKSIRVPEIASEHNLHELGKIIMLEVESRTKSCIPPKTCVTRQKRPAIRVNTNSSSKPNKRARLDKDSAIPNSRNISLPCEASTSMPISTSSHQSAFIVDRDRQVNQESTQPSLENLLNDASTSWRSAPVFHNNGLLSSRSEDRASSLAHSETHPNTQNDHASSSTFHDIPGRSPKDLMRSDISHQPRLTASFPEPHIYQVPGSGGDGMLVIFLCRVY